MPFVQRRLRCLPPLADALRAYAKQAGNREAEVQFAEIKVRAEIKCVELLKDMAERGERDTGSGGDRKSLSQPATVKLADIGLTRDDSSRYQQAAAAPREAVEEALAEARRTQVPLTSAQVRSGRLGRPFSLLHRAIQQPQIRLSYTCTMLVFIDESGCPGFKMPRGSDPVFAIGMVTFQSREDARRTEECMLGLHAALRHVPEFKFAKCSVPVRDGFFRALVPMPFRVRALMVEKQTLYSLHLRGNVDAFYSYFVKQLMAHDGGSLDGARVRIDGSGDREFQRALGAYLRRELGSKILDVKMSDSARDPLMQLADMCIGAIARSKRDRKDPGRWLKMLEPKIDNIWPFR